MRIDGRGEDEASEEEAVTDAESLPSALRDRHGIEPASITSVARDEADETPWWVELKPVGVSQ